MTLRLNRRAMLAVLASGAAGPALASAPLTSLRPHPRGTPASKPPSAPGMVRDAGLGGKIAYLAVEARTGRVIDALNPGFRMPPASVAKAATAYYTLSKLGAAYRFETVLEATGPVENGQITGDLILRGSGDPGFDSDAMADMIQALKDQGIHGVKGRFRVDASALPRIREIDPDQPDHVSYNPSVAGLNLNYNRVHFQWKKAGKGYDITLEARALRYSPSVRIARMTLEDRSLPVYTYAQENGVDQWTVARRMLGNDGARWLPVRRPVAYCDEVFRTIARAHGIVLKPGPEASGITGAPLVVHRSAPLSEMMESMLRYSTNLTAEVAGLTATRSSTGQPSSLLGSARAMNLWLNREVGARSSGFVDHSGLGYGARISPQDMVTLMRSARVAGLLPKILKPVNVATKGAAVVGKTGTLNFVSALSGYAEAPGTPPIVFAIFTGDLPRRDAIPVDQRERPPGARGWSRRSRGLQKRLIDRWLALASS